MSDDQSKLLKQLSAKKTPTPSAPVAAIAPKK